METTLYKITFKDGREYRVFCANKAQKDRMYKTVNAIKKAGGQTDIITNGIHNIKQWEAIIKHPYNKQWKAIINNN